MPKCTAEFASRIQVGNGFAIGIHNTLPGIMHRATLGVGDQRPNRRIIEGRLFNRHHTRRGATKIGIYTLVVTVIPARNRLSQDAGIHRSFLLDSGVLADQQLNERTKQRFASLSHVVNEREETQVEREFFL